MATALEILTSQSTLTEGTAWEHLNSQSSGAGSSLVLLNGLEVLVSENYTIEVDTPDLIVEIDTDLAVEVETQEYEVEV